MEYKNYLKLKRFSLRYDYYCIVDTEDYLAEGLFAQQEIKVAFGPEFGKEGVSYRMIFCKTRKRDRERFLEALEKLKDKMLLCGNSDYPEFCESIQDTLQKIQNQEDAA